MTRIVVALVLGALLLGTAAGRAEQQCEDEYGNVFFGDLDEPRNGPRPWTPCLPVGTWAAIRRQSDRAPGQPAGFGEVCAKWKDLSFCKARAAALAAKRHP